MRQLVRHRAAHLNEMSLRYSEAFDEGFLSGCVPCERQTQQTIIFSER